MCLQKDYVMLMLLRWGGPTDVSVTAGRGGVRRCQRSVANVCDWLLPGYVYIYPFSVGILNLLTSGVENKFLMSLISRPFQCPPRLINVRCSRKWGFGCECMSSNSECLCSVLSAVSRLLRSRRQSESTTTLTCTQAPLTAYV